jgi:hypothetical protein
MNGAWIGPASMVSKALEVGGAEVVEGNFRIEGTPIRHFMRDPSDDNSFEIVEVSPETMYFFGGHACPVLRLLNDFDRAFRITVGLPVAA